MNKTDYDFSGWATKSNIKCSDGRTIMNNAFKDNDGQKVPLVWNHQHDDPNEVLGHALLENRADGVYAYCKFNDTESGRTAKELVRNGDVDKLSIFANKLKTVANNVIHGCIREVSLVLAGANPGAYIDSVVMHGEGSEMEEEGVIYTDEKIDILQHSDEESDSSEKEDSKEMEEEKKEQDEKDNKKEKDEKTVKEVFDTLNEEQKEAVYTIVGQAIEQSKKDNDNKEDDNKDDDKNDDSSDKEENNKDKGDSEVMKHNVFDKEDNQEVLMHSEIINDAVREAKKYGSMKESFIAHAEANNMENYEILFPDATELYKEPRVIEEDRSWVAKVMNAVKHTPFSRVKTTFGRMSETEARAKGYIKGTLKTDVKMSFLNRVTTPTTVYIKNDIDRDDVIDITDFDIVAWQKREMRKNLDKELALAMLLGDGRNVSDPNKINEQNIRPVIKDN